MRRPKMALARPARRRWIAWRLAWSLRRETGPGAMTLSSSIQTDFTGVLSESLQKRYHYIALVLRKILPHNVRSPAKLSEPCHIF